MERKRKAPKLRWAYFQPVTSTLVFFRLDNNEILRPDWRERRGGGTVEHAVKRQQNIGGHKFSFACYTPGSVVWELATSKNEELAKWLAALPVFISASAMPAAGQQSALAPGVKRSGSRAAAANGVGAEGGETGAWGGSQDERQDGGLTREDSGAAGASAAGADRKRGLKGCGCRGGGGRRGGDEGARGSRHAGSAWDLGW